MSAKSCCSAITEHFGAWVGRTGGRVGSMCSRVRLGKVRPLRMGKISGDDADTLVAE